MDTKTKAGKKGAAAAPAPKALKAPKEPTEGLRFGTVGTPQTMQGTGTPLACKHMKELGLSHLEIAWVQSVRVGDEMCAQIKQAARDCTISLSVHAPYFINLNSQTTDLMEKSDARLLAAARRGCMAGATDIVFHPGSYHSQPPEQVYERAKQKMLEITAILREEGTVVTLRPETLGKSAMFGNLDEVLELSRDVPGVLPCIDWAHLHARRGDGSFNSYEEFAEALAKVRAVLGDEGLKRCHFHLSGIAYGPKGEKAHMPLNEADLRYRDLLQAFIDFGVEGTAAVEAPPPFHTADAMMLQATYRRLLKKDEPLEQPPD